MASNWLAAQQPANQNFRSQAEDLFLVIFSVSIAPGLQVVLKSSSLETTNPD